MKRLFIVLIIGFLFSGCDTNKVFEDYSPINPDGWHKDSLVVFDVPSEDTIANHNIYINIRNKGNYANSNIWLFLEVNSPGGEILTDTVEFTLAEPSGRWKGSGIGDLYDNQFLYRKNVFFPESGEYRFSLQQGMRSDVLPGINDVGIRIEKQN